MRLVVAGALLVAGVARADDLEIDATVGNDAFDGVLSHGDDNGFTNDLALAIRDRRDDLALGGSVRDRMITSAAVMRRSDLVEMFGTLTWSLDDLVMIQPRLGPTIAGDLGGLWVQSHWHRLTHTGPRDPRKTPAIYMDDFRMAGVAGARGEAGHGGPLRAYATLDGQVAVGDTGVTFVEGAGGLRGSIRFRAVELAVFGELALGRYHVDDAELAVPAAYRPGWQVDRRIGVRVGFDRYSLAFEYHTNETSSGEAFSEITFSRRADRR